MVICGSYMFDFSVRKNIKKKDITREEAIGKIVAHLCLTLRASPPAEVYVS
jgi:hypothetical protein